jgi:hypothetical protein
MKRRNVLQGIARVAVAGAACLVIASGAGLDYLASQANAVVVGSVAARTESANQVAFTINIDRVLSGSSPGSTVNVVHPWASAMRRPQLSSSQLLYGMWFLKQGTAGGWDVLTARPSQGTGTVFSLFVPALLTPPTAPPYGYAAGTSLDDKLAYEVAAGVAAAPAQSVDADPTILLDALGSMNSPAAQHVLAVCEGSPNPALQAVGVAGSLQRALPGAMQSLVELWPTISSDPRVSYVLSALRDSWRDPTPAGVQQLASLAAGGLAGSDPRAAAVRALAAIHTKESLPFLAMLLSSADPDEQVRAIYGLSSFANGCPGQTADNVVSMAYLQCDQPSTYKTQGTVANFAFRSGTPEQEATLVSFWQSWWDNHPELH